MVLRDECAQNCGPGAVAAPPRDAKVLICRESSSQELSGASRDRTDDLLHAIHAVISVHLARFPCKLPGYRPTADLRKPADLGSNRLGLGPRTDPWTQTRRISCRQLRSIGHRSSMVASVIEAVCRNEVDQLSPPPASSSPRGTGQGAAAQHRKRGVTGPFPDR